MVVIKQQKMLKIELSTILTEYFEAIAEEAVKIAMHSGRENY